MPQPAHKAHRTALLRPGPRDSGPCGACRSRQTTRPEPWPIRSGRRLEPHNTATSFWRGSPEGGSGTRGTLRPRSNFERKHRRGLNANRNEPRENRRKPGWKGKKLSPSVTIVPFCCWRDVSNSKTNELLIRALNKPKTGFEPVTRCLQNSRSGQLSYFGATSP